MSQREYTAFISYRHAPMDSAIAKLLHTMIEQYRIPKELQTNGRDRLGIVFRDQEELHASSDLSAEIRKVLDHTEFLIVICSESTGQSRWVPQEIDYFLEKHDRSHVLMLLAGGEPSQVMPYRLTHITDPQTGEVREVEPLAADVRADTVGAIKRKLRRELPRLVAPILGCPYDALVMREQKRKTRRLLTAAAAVLTVTTAFSAVLLMKNRQIEAQNQELISQKEQIQWRESELLALDAEEALANGHIREALELSLAAMPENSDQAAHPLAQSILMRSMNLFGDENYSNMVSVTELEQSTIIRNFRISEDGTKVVTMDSYRQVNCFDKETGALLWSHQAEKDDYLESIPYLGYSSSTTIYPAIFFDPIHDAVICCQDDRIESLELETGALRWYKNDTEYSDGWNNQRMCFDPRTGKLAFVRKEQLDDASRLFLELVDAQSGKTEKQIELGAVQESVSFPSVDTGAMGAFSADGRYFTGAYLTEDYSLDSAECHIYTVDLASGTLLHQYACDSEGYFDSSCIGMVYSADAEAVFAAFSGLKEDVPVTVLKISVQTGALLWASDSPDNGMNDAHLGAPAYTVLFRDESILVGYLNQLYSIDAATGAVVYSKTITDYITSMTMVSDGDFCISLNNGACILGWQLEDGRIVTTDDPLMKASFPVGQHKTFRSWGGGVFQIERRDGGFVISISNRVSPGFAAVQPSDQLNAIRIYQPVTLTPPVEREKLLQADALFDLDFETKMMRLGEQLLVWPVSYYDPDDMDSYGEEYFLKINITTGTSERTRIPEDILYDTIWCLSDGSGYYLEATGYGGYLIRDGAEPVALPEEDDFTGLIRMDCAYLNGDGPLLTAKCSGNELSWWIDGVPVRTLPIPEALQVPVKELYRVDRCLMAGENGLVLLRQQADDGIERLAVCDTTEGKWFLPQTQLPRQSGSEAFAVRQPLLAAADKDGNVHILDMTTGSELLQFPSGVSPRSILRLQFILEDEMLLLYTEDGLLRLYDLNDGSVKYSTFLNDGTTDHTRVWVDSENRRLYLANDVYSRESYGLCLDMQNWTDLDVIPGLLFFDAQTGEVYQYTQEILNDSIFSRFRVPDTAELYRLGRELLEQLDPAQP